MKVVLLPLFALSFLLGAAAIGTSVWMVRYRLDVAPLALPGGYKSPMIAFEFARDSTAVQALFGPPTPVDSVQQQKQRAFRDKIDRLNGVDLLFMFLYGTFLATFCLAYGAYRRHLLAGYLGATLSLLAAYCDFVENQQLFGITARLHTGDYAVFLATLNLFTRVKWGLIPLAMVPLIPAFLRGGWLSKAMALVSAGVSVLAAVALVPDLVGPTVIGVFTNTLFLLFFALLMYTALLARWGQAQPRWL